VPRIPVTWKNNKLKELLLDVLTTQQGDPNSLAELVLQLKGRSRLLVSFWRRRVVTESPLTLLAGDYPLSVRATVCSCPRGTDAVGKQLFLLVFLLRISASLHAQEAEPPTAEAKHISQGVVVDGRLNDPVWETAKPITDFRRPSAPVSSHRHTFNATVLESLRRSRCASTTSFARLTT
jgi:hypothetical protein